MVGAELETGTEVTERVQRVLGPLASVLQGQDYGSEFCWHLRSGHHFVHSEPGLPELGGWDGAVGWLSGEGAEGGREDAQQGTQPRSVVEETCWLRDGRWPAMRGPHHEGEKILFPGLQLRLQSSQAGNLP